MFFLACNSNYTFLTIVLLAGYDIVGMDASQLPPNESPQKHTDSAGSDKESSQDSGKSQNSKMKACVVRILKYGCY